MNIFTRNSLKLVQLRYFEEVITILIVLNTIVLATYWYGITEDQFFILQQFNYAFAVIFTLECILKITAYGKLYFEDLWNRFDFLVVIVTLIGMVLDITLDLVGTRTTIIRAFRLIRVFRLMNKAEIFKTIIDILLISLPQLANVGGLLLLILYIYAVCGMQLYSTVKLGNYLNKDNNFQEFFIALLTMVKISTGEGWEQILMDLITPRTILYQCTEDFDTELYDQTKEATQCGGLSAIFFVVSFQFIVGIIFLNIFVALILQNFENITLENEQVTSQKNIHNFIK